MSKISHIERRLALNTARLAAGVLPSDGSTPTAVVDQIRKDIQAIEIYWPELKRVGGEEPA